MLNILEDELQTVSKGMVQGQCPPPPSPGCSLPTIERK